MVSQLRWDVTRQLLVIVFCFCCFFSYIVSVRNDKQREKNISKNPQEENLIIFVPIISPEGNNLIPPEIASKRR